MESSTKILRRMLDERGVEWGNIRNDGSESDYLTEWQFENNQGKAIAIEWAVGSGLSVEIHRYHLTPAQAIAATLGSCNCSNNERTSAACKPTTYDNGYSADRVEPGEYYEFWEPACACGNCGELIPMRKFCPNCGHRLEVDA